MGKYSLKKKTKPDNLSFTTNWKKTKHNNDYSVGQNVFASQPSEEFLFCPKFY